MPNAALIGSYSGGGKFCEVIGDGTTVTFPITHTLNSITPRVYLRESSGEKRQVMAQVQYTSVNSVTVLFHTAPLLNTIRITVQV